MLYAIVSFIIILLLYIPTMNWVSNKIKAKPSLRYDTIGCLFMIIGPLPLILSQNISSMIHQLFPNKGTNFTLLLIVPGGLVWFIGGNLIMKRKDNDKSSPPKEE